MFVYNGDEFLLMNCVFGMNLVVEMVMFGDVRVNDYYFMIVIL